MKSRFLALFFTLPSLILSRAQDVMGPDFSCLRWSLDSHGQTRIAFLGREDAAGARLLYRTVWSKDLRMLKCEVNADPLVTDRFRSVCDRSGAQNPNMGRRFDVGTLVFSDAQCARVTSSAPWFPGRARRKRTEGRVRRKRAWILPGTLWCGRGSEAVRYEELGMFENTDRCCREHDHCLHVIPPFRVNYGVFNPNFYAVSHCECDQRFRQCLQGVNDTISAMVGYSFFNILRVPCFELKQQRRCTEMYWWGM
ncbi:hypothetical protein Q5P01_014716 [Channa striata]|uniref:phospholipase A2 n=1 Tax=Channa striata TaxID=64152 RepID=A0AA88SN48_CHASR|nr:hypothetical protein Q5P01_014716 [Channa striata]